MAGTTRTLAGLFGTTDFLMPLVLEDLTDEAARTRSRGDAGPSISWTIGHMLCFRGYILDLLGVERDNPWEEGFGQTAAGDGSDYPPIAQLLAEWQSLAAEFGAALAAVQEDHFDQLAPDPGGHGEQTVRDKVGFFAWHEANHMGAIAAIRKSLGLPGPAEKVMALREAAG